MKLLTTKPNNNLRQEFYTKNQLLRSSFTEISPQDYLSFVFSNKRDHDELVVVFGEERDGKTVKQRGTVKRVRFGEIWSLAWCQNAYIPYCDFKNNYYHSKTLESVRGFVNDCDGVTSIKLVKILRYLWNFLPVEPTHIVNSGKGLHFVYLLSRPIKVKGQVDSGQSQQSHSGYLFSAYRDRQTSGNASVPLSRISNKDQHNSISISGQTAIQP